MFRPPPISRLVEQRRAGRRPGQRDLREGVEEAPREPGQLAYLVQAVAPSALRERLSLLALSADDESPVELAPSPPIDPARAEGIARDYLNGTTLLRMAVKKFRRKLASRLGFSAR